MSRLEAGLAVFNAKDRSELGRELRACLRAQEWVMQLLALRPYPDVASLLTTAQEAAQRLGDEDVDSALSAHPRIGERPDGGGAQAEASRREQAGVDGEDPEVGRRLRAGNAAYEERFGHVFLIRAAGRSGPQVLAALEQRLGNDVATERGIVREQLAQIAELRLERMLAAWSDSPAGPAASS